MTNETTDKPKGVSAVGSETAPFIYLDGVVTYGVNGGAIQLELAAQTIVPLPDGSTRTEVVITGHVRCSPNAARALVHCTEQALALLEKDSTQTTQKQEGRLN